MPRLLVILGTSYLLGSIPFGYLLVRIFRGEDVRQSGSGNIGATNVARKSPVLGIFTLLLDALKGTSAVWLGSQILSGTIHASLHFGRYPVLSFAALFAVIGHMFPLWLRFRGGKGVATSLGAFAPLAPLAILGALGVFLLVTFVFRYVSLGSITAAASFPFIAWFSFRGEYADALGRVVPIGITAALIILKHHQNMRRLLAGSESRLGSSESVNPRSQ
jgi:acyl phosphate:glycerol-3-phosphate acyltransferase